MAKWLDKYEQGGLVLKKKTKDNFGKKANPNDVQASVGPDFVGLGYNTKGRDYSPAWGGQFAMGGALPGAVGFTYARVAGSAPANGKYTKKTKASAQDGKVLSPDADDRSILGFRTSDPAFQNVKSNAFVPFDPNNFEGIRQNIAGYMSSPLYMDRLSKSIPDAENAKETQQRRLNNLLSIKLNPKTVNEGTNYNRNQNRINLDATDFIDNAAISHEIAHGIVPNLTTSYGKQNMFAKAANVVGDLFQPFEQFSNSELEKINVPLSGKITAPNFDYMMARKEEHYKPQGSKASAKTAANETYGDLTGMRQLLLDNGITTEFGQDLTPEIFKKATENKRVMNSPAFKRMKLKFKDEDIIKMNNEVAMNDNKKDIPQAQLGIGLIPYVTSAAASLAASIPTMEEVKGKAIDVIKNSPKIRSAINKGISYVANTDWGKEKIKNFANNIDPHGYGNGYLRDMTTRSPFDRIYSAAILNKKEDSRKEMDSLLAAGAAEPGDSLRVDLINQYAGLPQKYNTVKPSAYKPTMGNKNDKYYSSPIIERQLLSDIDLVAGNVKMKPVFKTKQDLQNFVQKYFGGEKGKGDNYVTPIEGLGTATTGVGEDEKGIYLSYYDNWDLNPYHGVFSQSDDSFEDKNDKLGRAILGNEKEDIATKKIGTPTQMYGRIYFDKKTGKPKMQNGGEMSFYQNGLDFKPKSISKNGSVIKDDRGQWAHPGEVTEIGSNDITMQGVNYPVLGISDTGDTKMMQPGEDYKFDGEKVTEFPMMEDSGWLDKYKAQDGKSLAPYGSLQGDLPEVVVTSTKPSKWGKFKFAPYDPSKNPESISQWNPKPGEREAMAAAEQARRDEENSFYNNKHIKALRNSAFADWRPYAVAGGLTALPAIGSALGLGSTSAALAQPLFNVGGAGVSTGQVLSTLFAAQAAKGYKDETYPLVAEAIKNPTSDNVINAVNSFGWNTLNALPFVAEAAPGAKAIANEIGSAVNASKETGVLSKAWNINPSAEKLIGKTQRQTFGDPAYESFLKHGPTTQPEVSEGSQMAQWLKFNREASPVYNTGTGETMQIAGTTRFDNSGLRIEADYPFAYFSEGSPWYGPKGSARMAEALGVERRIVPKEGANLNFYPAGESSIIMNPEELTKQTINSYAGRRRVLPPFGEAFNPKAFDVYKGKPHWWKGYQKEAPPINKNKIDAITNVKTPWQVQELPGLHLSSTMEGGPISKIVEPKTGLINLDQALTIIGKESGGATKVDIIKKALGKDIPKKIDYNDFRKIVQDQLIPLDKEIISTSRSGYNVDKLGYTKASGSGRDILLDRINNTKAEILKLEKEGTNYWTDSYTQRLKQNLETDLNDYSNLPLENQTIRLSNKNKFGRGTSSEEHGNPEETLGHVHFLRDAETPDVLTVTQIQSDAFQSKFRSIPKSLEEAEFSLNQLENIQKTRTEMLKGFRAENNTEKIKQYEEIFEKQQKQNLLSRAEVENFGQKSLLDKNHQERYLQEIVDYAGKRGDINKIRIPTKETAAKVQNYSGQDVEELLQLYNEEIALDPKKFAEEFSMLNDQQKKQFNDLISGKIKGKLYKPADETILKKYAEQPKVIKKVFGVEPKIVTDGKGNSWYEFDIPNKFKGGKGEIKAFKDGGWLNKYK